MYNAAIDNFNKCDAAILCAAVADFKPKKTEDKKIKREKDDLCLQLSPTNDIAKELGKRKAIHQILIGFALETNDEDANARKKLEKKNLDFIVLNSTRNEGTTFQSDDNKIKIIRKTSEIEYSKKNKKVVACNIIDQLVAEIEQ